MLPMKMNMRSAVLAVVAVASLITGTALSAMNQYQNQAPQEASLQSFISGIVNAGACMLGYTDYCQKGEGGQWQVSPEMAKMFKDKVMQSFVGQGTSQAPSQVSLPSPGYYSSAGVPQSHGYSAGYGASPTAYQTTGYPASGYSTHSQAAAQPAQGGIMDAISDYITKYGKDAASSYFNSGSRGVPPAAPADSGFLSQLFSGLTGGSAVQ